MTRRLYTTTWRFSHVGRRRAREARGLKFRSPIRAVRRHTDAAPRVFGRTGAGDRENERTRREGRDVDVVDSSALAAGESRGGGGWGERTTRCAVDVDDDDDDWDGRFEGVGAAGGTDEREGNRCGGE